MPAAIKDIKEKTGLSLAAIPKYLNGGGFGCARIDNRQAARRLLERMKQKGGYSAEEIVLGTRIEMGNSVLDLRSQGLPR